MNAKLKDVVHKHHLRHHGAALADANAVVLLIHGRGATAESILPLGDAVGLEAIAYVAPQAEGSTWYPQSFMAPTAANEPYLSAALLRIGGIIRALIESGVAAEKLAIIGFSQGACLASETVLRNPMRYGFLGVLSGGAIGPPGTPRDYTGSLEGVRGFLGCADRDAHIPLARVKETTAVFKAMGANVVEHIYPGTFHGVNEDEISEVRAGLSHMLTS